MDTLVIPKPLPDTVSRMNTKFELEIGERTLQGWVYWAPRREPPLSLRMPVKEPLTPASVVSRIACTERPSTKAFSSRPFCRKTRPSTVCIIGEMSSAMTRPGMMVVGSPSWMASAALHVAMAAASSTCS